MRQCPTCATRYYADEAFCPHDGAPVVTVPDPRDVVDGLIGQVIDERYRIDKKIGEGGMGIVYLAIHHTLNRRFALKVLRGQMAKDPTVVKRFMREAQSASAIGHPNIVDISDFGKLPDGSVYFVMEYLEGTSLHQRIREGGITVQEVAHIATQIASALAAAHERGIVHRDLKPDNIMLVKRGDEPCFVKVLDFGIAKVGGSSSKLTKTGTVFGTPYYMSPEQALGHPLDGRTDLYALGVIMYEMVTTRVPFEGNTFMGVLTKHMYEVPQPPSQLLRDPTLRLGALEDVILKSLAKKREDRYANMTELQQALEPLRKQPKPVAKATKRIAPMVDLLPDGPLLRPQKAAKPVAEEGAVPSGIAWQESAADASLATPVIPPPNAGVTFDALDDATAHDETLQLPTTRPSWKLVVGGAGVLLVLGLWWWAGVGSEDVPEPAEKPVAAGQSASSPPTAASGGAEPPTAAQGAGSPVAPAASVAKPVEIISDPPGAQLVIDGVIIGNTPASVPRPAEGAQTLTLRMADHLDESVRIGHDSPDAIRVHLRVKAVPVVDIQTRPAPAAPRPTRPRPAAGTASGKGQKSSAPAGRARYGLGEMLDPWAD